MTLHDFQTYTIVDYINYLCINCDKLLFSLSYSVEPDCICTFAEFIEILAFVAELLPGYLVACCICQLLPL